MRFSRRAAFAAALCLAAPAARAAGADAILHVEQGGTAAATAAGARANLGAAASGANGDITGLAGLAAPLATTPGSIMGTGFTPTGVPAGYTETLAQVAVQSGVLVDTLKSVVDADDTMSFQRGCTNGLALLGGARTYLVHDFQALNADCPTFVFRGVPGLTVVQRASGTSNAFFDVQSSRVYIDGVIFDLNYPAVSKDQYGVMFDGGGQTIAVTRSLLKNSFGATKGSCLSIFGPGPAAGGSFSLIDDEVTNCAGVASVWLASVTSGDVRVNAHDNAAIGIKADVNGVASATNYISHVDIHFSKGYRNTRSGISIGSWPKPYNMTNPAAQFVTANDNDLQDNGNYAISMLGQDVEACSNKITQSSPSVVVFGGIDTLAIRPTVCRNNINLANTNWGIDGGGSIGPKYFDNTVTMNQGVALNVGGNANADLGNNHLLLSGTASGIVAHEAENDGSSVGPAQTGGFPTLASNIHMHGDTIEMSGAGTIGVRVVDDAGAAPGSLPINIDGEKFVLSGGAVAAQTIYWRGGFNTLRINNNSVNGVKWQAVTFDGSGDLVFDLAYFGGELYESGSNTGNVRSIVTRDIISAGTQILYVLPSAGGGGYTAATLLTPSAGCTWAGSAIINAGVIVGVQTTNNGSNCTGATVSASDSGGGAGATFTVGNSAALPIDGEITVIAKNPHLVTAAGGGGTSILPAIPFQVNTDSVFTLMNNYNTNQWRVTASNLPATFPSTGLPTCNAAAKGAIINVSGSASGKWQAACAGATPSWLYPDGTSAP